MIFDERKNLDFYRNSRVEGRYARAVDSLQNTDLEASEPGKYEIGGKNVYVNVTAHTTIPQEGARYGVHKHYTDIQYMIEGSEIMSYVPVHEMTVKAPYNPDKDVVFFENTTPGLRVAIGTGQYPTPNPRDAHKPEAANGESAPTKKVIVKIKED